MTEKFRIGIIGSGLIANVIAKAIQSTETAQLTAVASRRPESAEDFANSYKIEKVYDNWEELIASDSVDAVYIATPTSAREAIAIGACENQKHVLADKPFESFESLQKITSAAEQHGVAFMDATHFSHHPRSLKLRTELGDLVGEIQALRSCFFFPLTDRSNIRFDTQKEPTGAVGDMGWYCMRAITEFMEIRGKLKEVQAYGQIDKETNAIIRGAGSILFDDGKTSTFDFGFNTNTCLMDLDILGTNGMVRLDDFVLDWAFGFTFEDPDSPVGFNYRHGMMTPEQFEQIIVPNDTAPTTLMIQHFINLASDPRSDAAKRSIQITQETQILLDAVWESIRINTKK